MIKNIVFKFLSEKFKKESNILLFGSSTKQREYSDIDILIISEKFTVFSKEKFIFNENIFEVLIIPKEQVFELIEKDKAYGVYISIFKDGIIIKDDDGLIKEIKKMIASNLIKKSSFLRKTHLEAKIQERLILIKDAKNDEYVEFIFGELNNYLIDLYVLQLGFSETRKLKKKYELLNIYDNDFLKNIFSYKKAFLTNLDFEKYLRSLEKYFPVHNIFYRESNSTNYFLNEIYEDELVVHIKLFESELLKTQLSINKLLNSNNFPDYYYYSLQENKIFEKGTYLVVFQNKNEIKNKLIPKLNKFHIPNITFPYQIQTASLIGVFEKDLQKKINSFFIIISKEMMNLKKDKLPVLFINIYIGIYMTLGKNINFLLKTSEKIILKLNNIKIHENLNISVYQLEIYEKINFEFKETLINKNVYDAYKEVLRTGDLKFLPNHFINDVVKSTKFEMLNVENSYLEFNFFNMILNIFSFNDFQKLYIFHTIVSILKNEYEP